MGEISNVKEANFSNYNKDTIDLMVKIHKHAKYYGISNTDECYAQATVDVCEARFEKQHDLVKISIDPKNLDFRGDHRLIYSNNGKILYRSDEYPLSFDNIIKRIEYIKKLGLDGYITGRSLHLPATTFGMIAYQRGMFNLEGI